jgi:hypothetical protein
VVGIDYFFGDPVHLHLDKPGFDRPTWRTKSVEQAKASVPKWVDGVKEMFGTILFIICGMLKLHAAILRNECELLCCW